MQIVRSTAQLTPGYMSGFGNSFETEALPGALPMGRNSPQRCAYGLYAEQLSGSPFTAPRGSNERSWLYRIRPSVKHSGRFAKVDAGLWRTAPCHEQEMPIAQLRWDPAPIPKEDMTFLQGVQTMTTAGDANTQAGMAAHVYLITKSMVDQHFYNADGEMMFVAAAGQSAPRHRIRPHRYRAGRDRRDPARREIPRRDSERPRARLSLRKLWRRLHAAGARADRRQLPRQFARLPHARSRYEDKDTPTELYVKWGGSLFKTTLPHSPIDVVAWHGNYAPYKYDLRTFSPVGAIGFDHPDPSIFTVLTSPSETAGTANIDFVIFPERWAVAENTFRPPWYHMNIMSEFMGLIYGVYDAKPQGFIARRHLPAQHDAAAWPGPPGLRSRQQWRAEAGEADRHHGLHVRDAISAARHRACGEVGDPAGRLCRLLEGTGEAVRSEQAVKFFTLPLRGRVDHARSARSAGDGLSSDSAVERSPHPARSRSGRCADPPPQGEGEEIGTKPIGKPCPIPTTPNSAPSSTSRPTSDFPIQNLPYGVFSAKDGLAPRVGVAIGDYVLDLWQLAQDCRFDVVEPAVFAAPQLNPFMALGPKVWSSTRARISELLRHDHPELRDNEKLRKRALVPMADVKLHLPFAVSGYTDFYSSKEHATNVGVMFRGKDNALAAELAAHADRL